MGERTYSGIGRPPMPEEDLLINVPTRLPANVLAALDKVRSRQGLTRSEAVRSIVRQWLKERKQIA